MTQKYWFSAKRPGRGRGWGWGPPFTWQDWLVFAGFFVLLICSRKGEPPGRFPSGEQ